MKSILKICMFFVGLSTLSAQTQTIQLTQTPGNFTKESIDLIAGDYQFDIINKGVQQEVGFVLVPKGKYEATDHIKEAYVKAPVGTDDHSLTNVVSLAPGEYEYFCPLNPTPKYTLTVHESVATVNLEQKPGNFTTEAITLKAGTYQFNISNSNVDHEVGFVLVPKGKYAQENHIQDAYVKAPVPTNEASLTNLVNLQAGEYEYFCPLNPTPKYSLTVVE